MAKQRGVRARSSPGGGVVPMDDAGAAPIPLRDFAAKPIVPGARRRLDPRTLTGAINVDGSGASPRRGEPSVMALMPGALVPGTRYRVIEWLGEGGMGVVYEAEHVDIERRVALKILHSDRRGSSEALRQFREEAKTASKMGSDHVVEVFDFVELDDGRLMFAMELLRGTILSDEMQAGAIPVPRAIAIFRQVCKGLAAAHEAGIVHRDIKPENIALVERRGRADFVKLLDFGIAAVVAGRKERMHGQQVGTPFYMAPELLAETPTCDGRSDIYSLGCTMYEALVGHPPFRGANVEEVLEGHRSARPPSFGMAAGHGIPPKLEKAVMRCLAKDPDARFPNAHLLEAALCEAQIEAGIRTEWDDLPLPEVERKYRARLRRAMPDPRGVDSVSGPFDEEENDELDIPEPPARKRGGRVAIALASIVSLGAVGVAYGVASGRLDLREAMARVDLEVSPAADEGAGGAVSPPLEAEPERAAEPQVSPTPTEPAAEDAEDPQNAEVAGDPPEGSEPSKEEADPPEEEPVSPSSTAGSRHKRQVKGRDKAKEPDEKEEPAASDDESSIPKISKQQGGSAADLIAQAAEAKRAGNRAEAIELYEQALEKDPRNTIALTALSDMAFDRGRFSEAAEYAQRAVNAAPGNGLLRIKLGDAYLKLKQYDKARAEYQKAADLGNSKAEQRLEKVKGK